MRCGADVAPVRAAPSDDAEQVTQALEGEPLELLERRGDWAYVRTAYGYPGWVRAAAVEAGEGMLPAPTASSPLEAASGFLGAPYEWGGMTRDGIDCSGLVHMAYRLAGQLVPRDAWQQDEAATRLGEEAARPGDLAFYADPGGRTDHVAFWLGDGRILHATAREGLGTVEEDEAPELRRRRRSLGRLELTRTG